MEGSGYESFIQSGLQKLLLRIGHFDAKRFNTYICCAISFVYIPYLILRHPVCPFLPLVLTGIRWVVFLEADFFLSLNIFINLISKALLSEVFG